MWIVFAFLSALFAGLASVLAKCGIKDTDSTVAMAIRTVVVLVFTWILVGIQGVFQPLSALDTKCLVFLALSGIATGASWFFYYKALSIGDINKVVPIDKSSTVLTIVLAAIILGESITASSAVGASLILAGTMLMIEKKQSSGKADGYSYIVYAVLSAIFAALTSILGKIGVSSIDSTLATAMRTCIVLIFAFALVVATGKKEQIWRVGRTELLFIVLSGFATGSSWLCYYKALQDGKASIVVPIDKLSILVSIAFGAIVFKERLSRKSAIGLALLVAGTLSMLI